MKTLHIIPHTHWDREWYMPFEKHRLRLVQLIDALIERMEQGPEFETFHLDGQMIILEDYLEIKPQMKARLEALVRAGRIKIGPLYVLQDEYLSAGEASIRNLQIGLAMAKDWGDPVPVGYFPDAFGNVAQMPQILAGFGLDSAVFGRGLNEVGYDNQVSHDGALHESEFMWASPDGSQVLAILFANWYHNAMALSDDKETLREQVRSIVTRCEQFATTDALLGMNGCDHTPVQLNLPEVLALTSQTNPEVHVRFSDFEQYIKAVRKQPQDWQVHEGEIAGQYTKGYHLLVGTASTRVDTKQLNQAAQRALMHYAEPLSAFAACIGGKPNREALHYGWKHLLKNHPHDTLCGCSDDRVLEDMVTRLKQVIEVSEAIGEKAWRDLIGMHNHASSFVVFNPWPFTVTEAVSVQLDLPKEIETKTWQVITENGKSIAATVTDLGEQFGYVLPDDAFRRAQTVRRLKVTAHVTCPPGPSLTQFQVIEATNASASHGFAATDHTLESDRIRLTVESDGTITVYDKALNKTFSGLNRYEDTGDIGNTYDYTRSKEGIVYTTNQQTLKDVQYDIKPHAATMHVVHAMDLPVSREQDTRSKTTRRMQIDTQYTITHHSGRVDVKTTVDNTVKDHRLRVLFPTDIETEFVYAEGQFALNKRPIIPWEGWENPEIIQRLETFVTVSQENRGLLVATQGLHEYEVLRDSRQTLALTLIRSVGEIGDWGHFPTPNAQCLGVHTLRYAIAMYQDEATCDTAMHEAYGFAHQPLTAVQGVLPRNQEDLGIEVKGARVFASALKPHETNDSLIMRLFTLADQPQTILITVKEGFKAVYHCQLDETHIEALQIHEGTVSLSVKPHALITLEWLRS